MRHKYPHKIFAAILLLLFTVVQETQSSEFDAIYKDIHFEKIETDYMLNSILQDRDGFFWFGTQGGLVKFNGYDSEVFQEGSDSIPGNWVNVLYEDSEGLIWLGTTSGLGVYDKSKNTFTQFKTEPQDPTSISNDVFQVYKLQSIFEDRTGAIWFGTKDGLNKYVKESRTFTRFKTKSGDSNSLLDNDIWAISPSSEGMLWVSTNKGLHKFDPVQGIVVERYKSDNTNPEALHGHQIVALLEDSEGILWVGTKDAGLNRFEIKNRTFSHYKHDPGDPTSLSNNRLSAIIALNGAPDILWITTGGGGLNLFDKATGKAIHFQYDAEHPDPGDISGNILFGILQDQIGVVWVAGLGGALNKFDNESQNFKSYVHKPEDQNSLSKNQYIGRVIEDRDGTIWIAAAGGGLDRYARKTGKFSHFRHEPIDPNSLPETYCQSVFEDTEGRLWVTTENWIVHFDKLKGQVIKKYPAKTLPCVPLEDRNNPDVIWWGTWGTGLINFNKNTGTVEYITADPVYPDETLSSDTVFPFFQDDEGFFWIVAMGGGVDKFDPASKKVINKFKHIANDPTSLSSNTVWHIFRDSAKRLWIATERGLNLFNATDGTFLQYNKQNGLFPINTVAQILEDTQGKLWVAGFTTGKLTRFNPEDGSYKLFSKTNGIHPGISGPFRALKTRDGQLWFYGGGGITSFYPEEIVDNPHLPPVYLTSLKKGGEAINLDRAPEKTLEIYLDWRQNFFEFEAAALNYRNTGSNQYKYILEGFDKDWYKSGTTRKGRYSGLPGGEYNLRIKGSNNDGIWSDKEVALKVIVSSPFWRTWWFYCLNLVAGVLFSLLILQYLKRLKAEISERKQAEETLGTALAETQRFSKALDEVPAHIYMKDPQSRYIYANRLTLELFGCSAEELVGRDDSHFFPSDTVKRLREVDLRVFAGEQTSEEIDVASAGSERRIYLEVKTPIFTGSEHKTIWGVLGISTDITEHKKAEKELERYKNHLEQIIEERNEELKAAQIKLLLQEKLAAIGQLSGSVAHDIRNPLGIISNSIYFFGKIKKIITDNKLNKHVNIMKSAIERADVIITDLLDFSKENQPDLIECSINKEIRSLCEELKLPENVSLENELDSNIHPFLFDPSQLRRVLYNLLTNALQAMPTGGLLKISSKMNEGLVELKIKDNGTGIEAEEIEKIYEPLFTTKSKGVGLGLSITKTFVELHNGTIEVESVIGEGTTFSVTLPFTQEHSSIGDVNKDTPC